MKASAAARAVFASMWIGWQREIGWANPGLGLLLIAVAPASTVLSVALVFWVGASNGGTPNALALGGGLAYVIVGASLYAQVGQYAWVPNSAISEGKNTGLFTQVYMTPASSVPYLIGRCLASFLDSLPVVAISFVLAYLASSSLLGERLPLILSPLSILMVVVAMLASFPAAVGLGLILGAYSLFASRLEWALPSYIAGALMIFSEALFPLSVLPWPLSAVGQAVPFTYLMRASRVALLDPSGTGYLVNLGECVVTSVATLILGLVAYRWGESRARAKGLLDRKTR